MTTTPVLTGAPRARTLPPGFRVWARATQVAPLANALLAAAALGFLLVQRHLIDLVERGPVAVRFADLLDSDHVVEVGNRVHLVLVGVTGALWLVWWGQAHLVATPGHGDLRHGAVWSLVAWFVPIASLFVAEVSFGFGSPNIFAIGQTLAGPRAAGKWVGFQNCVGNLAGIVAPIVTGMVVDRTGEFTWAFAVAAAVSLTGVVGWGLMIHRVEPIDWTAATPPKPGAEAFAA